MSKTRAYTDIQMGNPVASGHLRAAGRVSSISLACLLLILMSGCSFFRGAQHGEIDSDEEGGAQRVQPERAVVHTVRQRETLSSISKKYSGSSSHWKQIVEANPGLKPAKLRPGDELLIPQPLSASRAAKPTAKSAAKKNAPSVEKKATSEASSRNTRAKVATSKDTGAPRSKSRSENAASQSARAAIKSPPPPVATIKARPPRLAETVHHAKPPVITGQPAKAKETPSDDELASGSAEGGTLPNHFFVCYRNRCGTKTID